MECHYPTTGTSEYFILTQDWTPLDGEVNGSGSLWRNILEEDREQMLVCVSNIEHRRIVKWGSCPRERFSPLLNLDFELLSAVTKDEDRLGIYQDPHWMEEGRTLQVNDEVTLQNISHLPDPDTHGVIRFKGHTDDEQKNGILFGIELDSQYSGFGSCNGTFRRKHFFSCEDNSGVFYPLKFIRKRIIPSVESLTPSAASISLHSDPEMTAGPATNPSAGSGQPRKLEVGERVIWFSDDGVEKGTVRWTGEIPGLDPHHKWYAGVEFDKKIGKGTGRYRGIQLFHAKKGHASLVPLAGLVRSTDAQQSTEEFSFRSSGSVGGSLQAPSQLSAGPPGDVAMQIAAQTLSPSSVADRTSFPSSWSGPRYTSSRDTEPHLDETQRALSGSEIPPQAHASLPIRGSSLQRSRSDEVQSHSLYQLRSSQKEPVPPHYVSRSPAVVARVVGVPHEKQLPSQQHLQQQQQQQQLIHIQQQQQQQQQQQSHHQQQEQLSLQQQPLSLQQQQQQQQPSPPLPQQQSRESPEPPQEVTSPVLYEKDVTSLDQVECEGKMYHVGDRVRVPPYATPRYGVVRWLGTLPSVPSTNVLAGVELDSPDQNCCTDGTLEGKRMFVCEPFKAFFVFAKMCQIAGDEEDEDT